MIKIGRKKYKNLSSEEKIGYGNDLYEYVSKNRRKKDVLWYLNYMFMEGNHYVQYNTSTNAIERPPRKTGEVRLVINKSKQILRSIQNYVTRFRPKWEVTPGDIDKETIKNARISGKMLDYLFRKLKLEILINSIIESSLNSSVAFVELGWDDKAEGGLGQIKIIDHDSFDIFVDPFSKLSSGRIIGSFIIKTVPRSLMEVKSDSRYMNRDEVKADKEIAASKSKIKILRKENGDMISNLNKRVMVKEIFLYDSEENSEGGHIHVLTIGGGQILRDEDLKNKGFPIYVFQIPQDSKKIYHRPWMSDIIPLNKVLDRTVSQKIMYVNQALVYRILAEKGSGITRIDNDSGVIYEYNPGRKIEQMQMMGLPSTLDSLTREVNSFAEDVGGVHAANMGALPSGARSGRQLEALQAADSSNISGIKQSLESFLSLIGMEILNIVAEKYVTSRIIKITEPEDKQNFIKVIGQGANNEPKNATIITKDNEVIVTIGSWLGYTREAQRKTLIELGSAGILPAEAILREFEFPNVEELSAKARAQRNEEGMMKAEIAGRNQQPQQQPQDSQMVQLADKENTRMMNSEPVPPTQGADLQHTQGHLDFVKSNIFQKASAQIKQIFAQHIQGEMQQEGIKGGQQGGQQ